MKLITNIILLLLIPVAGFSQRLNDLFFIPADSVGTVINFYGEAYHSSGDLQNEFTNKFIRGGYIDSTLKKDVLEKLKTENRIGAEVSFGVNYQARKTQFFGLPQWGWMFGVENNEYYNLNFSRNAFELAFFGNKNFAGDTVNLAPLDFNQLRFQKLSFGIFNKRNNSSINIGILKGEDFIQMQTNRAQLYTESGGNQLALNLNETLTRSDTSNNGLLSFNGWGICTDLTFYINTGKNRNVRFKNPFKISIQNFGFMVWNKNSLHQQTDSSYQYNGFSVDNVLTGISNPFVNTSLSDTLGIKNSRITITQLLPFTFSVSKITDPFGRGPVQAFYGVRLRAKSNYKPMVYAGINYNFQSKINASVYASFGGYGGFRAGIQVSAFAGKHIRFSINSSDLIGWVSTKGYGRDVGFTLNAFF